MKIGNYELMSRRQYIASFSGLIPRNPAERWFTEMSELDVSRLIEAREFLLAYLSTPTLREAGQAVTMVYGGDAQTLKQNVKVTLWRVLDCMVGYGRSAPFYPARRHLTSLMAIPAEWWLMALDLIAIEAAKWFNSGPDYVSPESEMRWLRPMEQDRLGIETKVTHQPPRPLGLMVRSAREVTPENTEQYLRDAHRIIYVLQGVLEKAESSCIWIVGPILDAIDRANRLPAALLELQRLLENECVQSADQRTADR